MTRPLRIEFSGALYHVTSRGNAREYIFQSDRDRKAFLELLGNACDRHSWFCHAYCLMSNHYHLLLETSNPTLSKGMKCLNGTYTQHYLFYSLYIFYLKRDFSKNYPEGYAVVALTFHSALLICSAILFFWGEALRLSLWVVAAFLLAVNFFLFLWRRRWEKYVEKFNMLPAEVKYINHVFSIVVLVFIVIFYLVLNI